ncbi:MAG: signal peptidase II [Hyphomicrobiaceae bacterium]|nr:signal peptidase II [Hyphomicrobiaceae bacterium]
MARTARRNFLWGPMTRFGLLIAMFTTIVDQALKWWVLEIFQLESKGTVKITPFLDLVMVWNRGISYGLFQQDSTTGRFILIGLVLVALTAMFFWLARATTTLSALALGLVLGGGVGNLIDRLVHGAVADFISFHAFGFYWYVFNIADAAIVAGVVGLLYDSMFNSHKKVSNTS